jgi:hypothetical protein
MHAGARGELRRCQPRQRLPGANHTAVAITDAFRALIDETRPCKSVVARLSGCVVTNEIRFLTRITLIAWISRAMFVVTVDGRGGTC